MSNGKLVRSAPCVQAAPSSARAPEGPSHGWFDRFTRLISLIPPGAPVRSGPVALGVTSGHRIHVLYKEDAATSSDKEDAATSSYGAFTTMPGAFLREPAVIWSNARVNARVVDGAWAHGHLWLLSSSGYIVRYTPFERPASGATAPPHHVSHDSLRAFSFRVEELSDDPGAIKVEPPRGTGDFRALSVCRAGLAVLVSDEVTVLGLSPSTLKLVKPVASERWVAVPGALGLAITRPFDIEDYTSEPVPIDPTNPLFTVVAASRPGLRWIGWDHGVRPHLW